MRRRALGPMTDANGVHRLVDSAGQPLDRPSLPRFSPSPPHRAANGGSGAARVGQTAEALTRMFVLVRPPFPLVWCPR